MHRIYIKNEQKKEAYTPAMRSFIQAAVKETLAYEQFEDQCEVSVTLVDNEKIKALNSEYRNKDRETYREHKEEICDRTEGRNEGKEDFFFLTDDGSLGSTFDSRAELEVDLPVNENVNVRLAVADDDDEIYTMKKWEKGEFRAAKLSIGINAPKDVMVFMPVSSQHFCYNSQESLGYVASLVKEINMVLPETTIESQLTTRYGDTMMICNFGNMSAVATVSYGKRDDGVEGIEVLITGVTPRMISYLRSTYESGLTVEVWCYFRNTLTREDLRDAFSQGTTVMLSDNAEAAE